MASDLITKAKEAFIDDHFELAVDFYSQAIAINPNNADLFSDRAQANIKLENFTEAVSDANKAIELDPSNSKAYLRKGIACFNLEEYHTAKTAFEAGASLVPEDTRFRDGIKKCDKCIAGTENIQNSQNTGKLPRGDKWDTDEDVALMSAWIMASEDSIRGKNQKGPSLWGRVKQIYDASQMENPNPKRFSNRNIAQMKGRWKRLNENVQKWVAAYREAYRHKRSGMSMKDVENEAHKIYEAGGSKFNDSVVFNRVMCNHPKWDLQLHRDTTRTEREVGDEESGSSTKRSRTSEEGDYCFPSNPEKPNTGGSSSQRPTGRDMAKKKGKCKVSNEIVEEIRALRLTRVDELEVMKKKLDLEVMKEQKKEERETKKMQTMLLNTLLAKGHLSPEDEETKRFLLTKMYGM